MIDAIPPSKAHGCITILPCEVCELFNQVLPKVPKDFYESQLRKYEVELQLTKLEKSLSKRKTTKIDYTLEQFLLEQQKAFRVTNTLEKISSVLDKLDKRISKLEKKK